MRLVPKNRVDVRENRVVGKTFGHRKGHPQARVKRKSEASFVVFFLIIRKNDFVNIFPRLASSVLINIHILDKNLGLFPSRKAS